MHLGKMINLMNLSLNLGYNEIGNKGFLVLLEKIDNLINLINLSLELGNNKVGN